MRAYFFLFLFVYGVSFLEAHSVSQDCETALQSLFSEEISSDEAGEFLKLQGDITLHRLAWAYLKAQKTDSDSKVQSVERTILELLNEKYTKADPNFVKAREAFEAQPLARSTLAEIAPYLKEVLSHEYGQNDQTFKLNASDLKLLSALSRHERSSAVNGRYDHRLLDAEAPQAVLNFVKLVNSSYKIHPSMAERDLQIDHKLLGLEKTLKGLEVKLENFLRDLTVPSVCAESKDCSPDSTAADFFNQSEDVQNIFWESLAEKLETDDVLLERLSYGDLWLQVKAKKQSLPVQKPPVKIPARERKKPFSEKLPVALPVLRPLKPALIEEAGLLIEDPIALMLKDKPGRSKEELQSLNPDFRTAIAQAIVRNDSVFMHNGKLYDRKTGKEADLLNLAKSLSASNQQKLQSSKPEMKLSLAEALLNKKETFILNNEIYDLSGKKLSPALVISEELGRKLSLSIEPGRFREQRYDLLVARAHALKNDRPYFVFENRSYDSLTGNDVSSPFRAVAGASNAKVEKVKRRMYENLPNKEIIRNFHRENPDPNCRHYGVIDKTSAELKIYSNSGEEAYRSEVLVGAEASDQKTRWTDYSKRVASSSTGAGIFTIRPQDLSDEFNRKNFNNNILSFKDESNQNTVFAIHQVPVNLRSRYGRFGTNDPGDRRISGGCANLKLQDFLAVKKWLGPSCKVYVLPEESGNKFILRDNKLKLISSAPVPAAKAHFYNYSSLDSEPRPIKIKINNKLGDTQVAREFVKALEDEKAKLMKACKLSNDEYNDLAMLSYGILGNESSFGNSERLKIKEYTLGGLHFGQAAVILGRAIKGRDDAFNTSRGLTQIKNLPGGCFKEAYPEINKDNLVNPRNAAVATMGYLVDASVTMRNIANSNQSDPAKLRITRENMIDYMGYLYQGGAHKLKAEDPKKQATPEFNRYYRNLQLHMSYIEMTQKIE